MPLANPNTAFELLEPRYFFSVVSTYLLGDRNYLQFPNSDGTSVTAAIDLGLGSYPAQQLILTDDGAATLLFTDPIAQVDRIAPDGTIQSYAPSDPGLDAPEILTLNAAGNPTLITVGVEANQWLPRVNSASMMGAVRYDPASDAATPGAVAEMVVDLLDAGGSILAATWTDDNGAYSFEGLPAGEYSLWFDDSFQYRLASPSLNPDIAPDTLQSEPFAVSAGSALHRPDLSLADAANLDGEVYTSTRNNPDPDPAIHWTVFLDLNQNGQYDEGEPSRITNRSGEYSFDRLPTGTYSVVVVPRGPWKSLPPERMQKTISVDQFVGGDNAFFLPLKPTATIRGTVQTIGPPGQPDAVTVPTSGLLVTLSTIDGDWVADTSTDSDGHYSFDALETGQYTIDFDDWNEGIDPSTLSVFVRAGESPLEVDHSTRLLPVGAYLAISDEFQFGTSTLAIPDDGTIDTLPIPSATAHAVHPLNHRTPRPKPAGPLPAILQAPADPFPPFAAITPITADQRKLNPVLGTNDEPVLTRQVDLW